MRPRDRSEVGWEESDGNVFHPSSEILHSFIHNHLVLPSFIHSSAILPRIRVRDCINCCRGDGMRSLLELSDAQLS